MNSDYIAYEAMLVAKANAEWAFWAMIASLVSSFAAFLTAAITMVAAFVAYKTMNTWKQQEYVKERKELKAALVGYRNTLVNLPNYIHRHTTLWHEYSNSLNDEMNKIYLCAVVMEEDLDNGELGKKITDLHKMHFDYLSGNLSQMDLAKYLSTLLAEKLIQL
ncbi:hypothetical protein [Pectobacterium brasiliense]|uniref:hypothetical protein n=1 Tax=Pectobacterium brasiliense TaxID=180957 RepID=UPI0019690882|nr:hypothetical protein [Pectobacterium brasiliense]MBN3145353.1 hypothetical protein [Pectobacterium brasiliense]